MDLDDYHNNFYAGIHAANMAGTWQALVNGFGGVRVKGGHLILKPYLPPEWDSYEFCLEFQMCRLKVTIDSQSSRFELIQGQNLEFYINKNKILLVKEGDMHIEKI